LFRSFFSNYLWEEKRVYSKAEAWLDLIRRANYKDQPEYIKYINSYIKYGEVYAPIRSLSKWWGWNISKVHRFLEKLKKHKMIRRSGSIIHLINYKNYNSKKGK